MIQLNMRIINQKTPRPSLFAPIDASKYPSLNPTITPQFPGGRLQIMTNYVEPIFRVEKIHSNALTTRPQVPRPFGAPSSPT